MASPAPDLLGLLERPRASDSSVMLTRDQLGDALEWLFPGRQAMHAELEVVVLQRIAEEQPLDAYELRLGPWRLDVGTRLAQAAIASAALGGAIEVAGASSIPVVLLAVVLRFLVDVERVEVRTRDRLIHAVLQEPVDPADPEGTYAVLPEEIRSQLTLFEFSDTLDRLQAAGMLRRVRRNELKVNESPDPTAPDQTPAAAGDGPAEVLILELSLDPPA